MDLKTYLNFGLGLSDNFRCWSKVSLALCWQRPLWAEAGNLMIKVSFFSNLGLLLSSTTGISWGKGRFLTSTGVAAAGGPAISAFFSTAAKAEFLCLIRLMAATSVLFSGLFSWLIFSALFSFGLAVMYKTVGKCVVNIVSGSRYWSLIDFPLSASFRLVQHPLKLFYRLTWDFWALKPSRDLLDHLKIFFFVLQIFKKKIFGVEITVIVQHDFSNDFYNL